MSSQTDPKNSRPVLTRGAFLQSTLVGMLVAAGCGDSTSGNGGNGGGNAGGNGNGGSPEGGNGPEGGSGPSTGGGGSGEGGSGGGGNPLCTTALVALVSNNHGHALTVPLGDLDSTKAITYDVSGTAKHCHEVTITAEDFATLRAGGSVTLHTCNGGDHEFTLSCVDAPEPSEPDCEATPDFGSCG
jgi:hypothetical protein